MESGHQVCLTGLHANGVPSMSTVIPVVTNALASAVNVAPIPAVSQAPASGSGSAPPSSTSRHGVVLANADGDDDSEESYDDDTSGSGSEEDSEEEVEVEHGDVDIESLRSRIADDSVMFPSTLPGEEKVNEFPIDAADVVARVVRDLGITPPQSVQEPVVQGIFIHPDAHILHLPIQSSRSPCFSVLGHSHALCSVGYPIDRAVPRSGEGVCTVGVTADRATSIIICEPYTLDETLVWRWAFFAYLRY